MFADCGLERKRRCDEAEDHLLQCIIILLLQPWRWLHVHRVYGYYAKNLSGKIREDFWLPRFLVTLTDNRNGRKTFEVYVERNNTTRNAGVKRPLEIIEEEHGSQKSLREKTGLRNHRWGKWSSEIIDGVTTLRNYRGRKTCPRKQLEEEKPSEIIEAENNPQKSLWKYNCPQKLLR